MGKVHVVIQGRIHAGKEEEFRQVGLEALEKVRSEGPGTERWEFYFAPDGKECVVLESYADANGLLAHLGNMGPIVMRLFSLIDAQVALLGDVSDELRAALAGIPHAELGYGFGVEKAAA